MLDKYLAKTPYSLPVSERRAKMLEDLNALTQHHAANCESYRQILDGLWGGQTSAARVEDVPYLPVSLFKTHQLRSVSDDAVRATLTSSGTTGAVVSQIYVDSDTSRNQQLGLTNSLGHILGKKRLPMLVLDTDATFRNPKYMNARGAGVLGMMRFGRDHHFALTPDLEPALDVVETFLDKHGDGPFFMFGFTFLVWARFFQTLNGRGLDLSNGVLIHSGGWKKMEEQAVDNTVFRASFKENFRLEKIYNFYGMVEQLGSIFLEGPDGLLYPPNFSDVIIRDPETFAPAPTGTAGIIQVLSLIPGSYPGHSLLTEDMGVIEAVDADHDGWNGNGLRVIGRVPKAELRGCSDVVSQKLSA
jgi:hypothetical protein